MEDHVIELLGKSTENIQNLYNKLRQIVYNAVSGEVTETLWARLPTYYVGENFVRLIPFKDHINIEAKAILSHADELSGYKITPKGMLQIYLTDKIPEQILQKIFAETLTLS